MADNDFKNINSLEQVLESLGADEIKPAPKLNPLQEAREAIRKDGANEIEQAYQNTIKSIGNKLNYSSPRYLIPLLFGTLMDGVSTLWDPIKKVMESSIAKEMIEEQIGKGKTLIDYFNEQTAGIASSQLEDLKELMEITENYPIHLAEYCKKTAKNPNEVLQSPGDKKVVIERSYGSIENYEKIQIKNIRNLFDSVNKLKKLENTPFDIIIPAILKSKIVKEEIDLSEIGIDADLLGRIAGTYIEDISKFGKTFLTELGKSTTSEIKQYKALNS